MDEQNKHDNQNEAHVTDAPHEPAEQNEEHALLTGEIFRTNPVFRVALLLVLFVVAAVAAVVVNGIAGNRATIRAHNLLGQRQALVTETIIAGFHEAASMITMEADMQHRVEIAERGGFLWLGTREQVFTFHGTGIFTTDLSTFSSDNVIIDSYRNRIWVSIQRPEFYGVIPDWDNTEIDGVTTSFFGWGSINLTPEAFNEIMLQAGRDMDLLARQDLTSQAYIYTEAAIRNLLVSIFAAAGIDGYDIHVTWQ
ncbi:MAG: DUF4230 domain-containing protein [Defluviitaleaceae bacterium]|nr:DUF4230 domain-containing protein [Defluviitaleaceae bacterium]